MPNFTDEEIDNLFETLDEILNRLSKIEEKLSDISIQQYDFEEDAQERTAELLHSQNLPRV